MNATFQHAFTQFETWVNELRPKFTHVSGLYASDPPLEIKARTWPDLLQTFLLLNPIARQYESAMTHAVQLKPKHHVQLDLAKWQIEIAKLEIPFV
jgi:hypothetical protein